jgi:Cupin-like domain
MSSKLHDPYFQWLDYKALGLLDTQVEPVRTEVLPAREFRRKFTNTSTPCIITGATKGWPAFSKWSFDHFKTNFGTTRIPICYNDGKPQMSTVGEYIDKLLTFDPRCGKRIGHAKNVLMPTYIKEILADLRFPCYHFTDRLTHRGLWFAFDCATSNVHADFGHNMNVQVVGRKHFRLSGPTTIEPRFFHTRNYRTNYTFLDYDEPAPAANGNPAMPKMKAEYNFILERGEILFVPYGWWHKVTSIGPSISATHFWLTPAMVLTAIAFIAGMGDIPRSLLMRQIGPNGEPPPRFYREPRPSTPEKSGDAPMVELVDPD